MKPINKDEIKTKLGQVKWRTRNAVRKAEEWAKANPEKALAIASGTVAVARYLGKTAIKDIQANREAELLKKRCYDPSKGHYYYLTRELSNKEWLMVDRRRDAGEKLGDILEEMKVLKR